jgi:RNA polymerase sigma factor (sigma-70 family)
VPKGERPGGDPRASEDLVALYLQDIGRHRLLTRDDEVRLSRWIQEGTAAAAELRTRRLGPARRARLEETVRRGEDAKRQFVNANLRLVVSIAKRYQASGLPLLDLIQEGNFGLLHAVEKFDWRKGFKFSTYATWWIRQAIQRGIANTGRTIRLPVHAAERLSRVLKAQQHLEATLDRAPLPSELAAEAGVSEAMLSEVLRMAGEPRSLSEPLSDDSDTELGDLVADPRASAVDETAALALAGDVERALAPLEPAERQVLMLRYGFDGGQPLTLVDAARELGLPVQAARAMERRALAKLRHPSNLFRIDDQLIAS